MKLKCEICSEIIGTVDLKKLALPLTSEMFGSPDARHGVPPPFNPELTWRYFKCPVCNYRPLLLGDRILTDEGYVEITQEGARLLEDGLDDVARTVQDRVKAEDAVNRMVREEMGLTPKVIVSDEVPDDKVLVMDGAVVIESTEPIPPMHLYEVKADPETSGFICVKCSKSFREKRFLGSHMSIKHPEVKHASRL